MNVRIALALAGAWLVLALGAQAAIASAPLGSAPSFGIVGTIHHASVAVSSPGSTGVGAAEAPSLAVYLQTTPKRVLPTSAGAADHIARRTPFNGLPWLPLAGLAGLAAFVLRKIWQL